MKAAEPDNVLVGTNTVRRTDINFTIGLMAKSECVTFLELPGSGVSGLLPELTNRNFLKEFISQEQVEKFVFVQYDCSLGDEHFEAILQSLLSEYSQKPFVLSQIQEIVAHGRRIVFLWDNFNFGLQKIPKLLNLMRNLDTNKVSIIFSMPEYEFRSKEKDKHKDFSVISHNIIRPKYFTEEESRLWLRRIEDRFGVELSKADREIIVKFSGGNASIIKNLIRNYIKYQDITLALESEEMKSICHAQWNKFFAIEQAALKSIYQHINLEKYKEIISYFKIYNLLDEQGNLKAPWMLGELLPKGNKNLMVKDGGIFWDDFDISKKLSSTEFNIIKDMLTSKENLITRIEVAKILWPNSKDSSYNDWAIDKVMSRLRQKLTKIGIGGDIIKTVKGQGYQL